MTVKLKYGILKKRYEGVFKVAAFTNIKDIVAYVKPLTQKYRRFPSQKQEIIEQLKPIFQKDAEAWGLVIEYNKFVASFHDALGKRGRNALKKLLYELDYEHYKEVDFDVD